MAAVSIPLTTWLWSIRENHITDTLSLTESVWEQGAKTNGPIQYNVGPEWSWQKLQQPNSPTKLVWEDLTNLQKPETGRVKTLWKWRELNSVTGKGVWTSKVTTINQIDGKPHISETILVSCDASVKVTHTCATVTPKWRAPMDRATRGLSPITRTHLLLRALPAC